MNVARPRTVLHQLDVVLAELAEINRKLRDILENETLHNAAHKKLEARLDKVEHEIESFRKVNP